MHLFFGSNSQPTKPEQLSIFGAFHLDIWFGLSGFDLGVGLRELMFVLIILITIKDNYFVSHYDYCK